MPLIVSRVAINITNDHASLMAMGHADVRGWKKDNLKLSGRRVERVKSYLVSQGISVDQIQTRAEGKQPELSKKEVSTLETEDPPKPEQGMRKPSKATWLAQASRNSPASGGNRRGGSVSIEIPGNQFLDFGRQ